MAHTVRQTQPTYIREGDIPEDAVVTGSGVHPLTMAARVVWFITGVIMAVLAIRFIFVLLGANPANGFANFIYSVTHPLVAPFFSLFNYHFIDGVARFEGYTLVAIIIYALIGYGIARLLTIGRPNRTID
jgi:YggT family protein